MSESYQILIVAVSLLIGCVSVVFAHRLMKKYRLAYLSTYFYFLVFLFVFSIYGILGSGISRVVLLSYRISEGSVQTVQLILVFLGLPFLILSLYMFYRFCRELSGQELSRLFTPVYFIAQTFLFLGYAYLLFRILRFGEDLFGLLTRLMFIAYCTITGMIVTGGLLRVLLESGKLSNHQTRKANQLLGTMYAGFFTIQILLLIHVHSWPPLKVLFLFILFSFHMIPILFLNIFLDKTCVEPRISDSPDRMLAKFTAEYGISRRETEIVELICEGKSNQQISDALYISLQTVKDHIHRIYLKTGIKNRVQLTNLIRQQDGRVPV